MADCTTPARACEHGGRGINHLAGRRWYDTRVRRWLRRHPIAVSALATAIAAAGALLIAHVTGADAIGRAFDEFVPGWIALIAGAEALTYPAYAMAYRSVACVHGHPPLSLPLVARVVAAGVLHTLAAEPLRYAGAWLGTVAYWAADIAAFYAALRTFGLHIDVGRLLIAYATGY